MILHQEKIKYKTHCQFYTGQFVQGTHVRDPSNTQHARTIDALYLHPLKDQNEHEVYNIVTESQCKVKDCVAIPIPNSVVKAVEAIAAKQGEKGLRIRTKRKVVLYDSSWTAGVDYRSDADKISAPDDATYQN